MTGNAAKAFAQAVNVVKTLYILALALPVRFGKLAALGPGK